MTRLLSWPLIGSYKSGWRARMGVSRSTKAAFLSDQAGLLAEVA